MELVGRTVRKDFPGFGTFSGVVESYDPLAGYFRIEYEDGDSEEVDFEEIGDILKGMGEPPPIGAARRSARSRRPKKRRRIELGSGCPAGGRVFSGVLEGVGVEGQMNDGGLDGELAGKRLDFNAMEVTQLGNNALVETNGSFEDNGMEIGPENDCESNGVVFGHDQGGESTSCGSDSDEKGRNRRWTASGRRKCIPELPLRRSARRAHVALQVSRDHSMLDENQEDAERPVLPPSSNDLDVLGLAVLDLFSVYTCLRSFSRLLFLSPFTMETFVAALRCAFPNSLIDSIHYSILQILKPHLESLAEEGSQSASDCLRSRNWELLDAVTWPVYLAEYLLIHGSPLSNGYKLTELELLNSEYYKQPPEVKLEILRCLCDDVVEVEAIRSELSRRMMEYDLDVDANNGMSIDRKRNDYMKIESGGSSLAPGKFEETADGNSDECCLCRMDGILICCDGCPAAFHSKCVGVAKDLLPEGDWYCPECVIDKSDSLVKPVKPFQGAEFIGIDPHGRLYFGSCGYLLVLENYTGTSCYFYNRKDLDAVMKVLNAFHPYGAIVGSIYNCAGVSVSTCSPYRPFDDDICKVNGAANIEMLSGPLLCSKPDFVDEIVSEKILMGSSASQDKCDSKSSIVSDLTQLDPINQDQFIGMTFPPDGLDPSDEIRHAATCVQMSHRTGNDCSEDSRSPTNKMFSVKPIHLAVGQKKCIGFAGWGCTSLVNEHRRSEPLEVQIDPSCYVNYYSFGHLASSVAIELMQISSESYNRESERHLEDIELSQLKVVSKKCRSFRCNQEKQSVDLEKEKCGWCFSCKSSDESNCIFGHVDKQFDCPKSRAVGLPSEKHKKNHIFAAIYHILSLEDRVHGLLSGPWDNPHYRKGWRKAVLKASDIASLKNLLLTLESNLRRVTLSAEWMKPLDSDHRVGSASHVLTSAGHESSNRGGNRKQAKKISSGAEIGSVHHDIAASGIYWWRGGKLSRQVFRWKMLPRSLASKGARQAGCRKIPGVSYPDGLEFAKRSKCVAWRGEVEMSGTVAQLLYQVKDFDSNIKWAELSNTQLFPQLTKESKKSFKTPKKVTICKKLVEGLQVKYLLDFGKKEAIPAIVTRYGVMLEESSNGSKKFWVNESHVPLNVLKAFEEKNLACLLKKKDSAMLFEKENKDNVKKRKRSEGLSYLFIKAQELQTQLCRHCNKEVLVREAVNCQYCDGFLHKKHFRVPKGAITTTYTCVMCKDKLFVKAKVRDFKATFVKTKVQGQTDKDVKTKAQDSNASCMKRKAQDPKMLDVKEKAPVLKITFVKAKAQDPKVLEKPEDHDAKLQIAKAKAVNPRKNVNQRVASTASKPKGKPKKGKAARSQRKPSKGKQASQNHKKLLESNKGNQCQLKTGRFNKLELDINFHKRKRTKRHHSYWLNGLLWARKPDDERVRKFIGRKVLLPSQPSEAPNMQPLCCLCRVKYNSGAIYVNCENCGDWFHGEIFSLSLQNISNLMGFKCHKCRMRSISECPFMETGASGKRQSTKNCDSEAEAVVSTDICGEGHLHGDKCEDSVVVIPKSEFLHEEQGNLGGNSCQSVNDASNLHENKCDSETEAMLAINISGERNHHGNKCVVSSVAIPKSELLHEQGNLDGTLRQSVNDEGNFHGDQCDSGVETMVAMNISDEGNWNGDKYEGSFVVIPSNESMDEEHGNVGSTSYQSVNDEGNLHGNKCNSDAEAIGGTNSSGEGNLHGDKCEASFVFVPTSEFLHEEQGHGDTSYGSVVDEGNVHRNKCEDSLNAILNSEYLDEEHSIVGGTSCAVEGVTFAFTDK